MNSKQIKNGMAIKAKCVRTIKFHFYKMNIMSEDDLASIWTRLSADMILLMLIKYFLVFLDNEYQQPTQLCCQQMIRSYLWTTAETLPKLDMSTAHWHLKSPRSLSGHPPHHGNPKVMVNVMNDQLKSFSFHVSQPSHSWNKTISKYDLETSRLRSWLWSQGKTIQSAQYLNSHIWQSLSLRNWRWNAAVTLVWMGATFSGSSSWPPEYLQRHPVQIPVIQGRRMRT